MERREVRLRGLCRGSGVQGEGVLLGRSALVSADLAAGRLVRPFDLALKSRWKYYVVYPDGALQQKKVKAFRDWLFAEMAQTRSDDAAASLDGARPSSSRKRARGAGASQRRGNQRRRR